MAGIDKLLKVVIMLQLANMVPISIKKRLVEEALKMLDIPLTMDEYKELEEYYKPYEMAVKAEPITKEYEPKSVHEREL